MRGGPAYILRVSSIPTARTGAYTNGVVVRFGLGSNRYTGSPNGPIVVTRLGDR